MIEVKVFVYYICFSMILILLNLLNFKFLFVFMDIYVYGIFWEVWYIEYNECLLEVYNINNLNC